MNSYTEELQSHYEKHFGLKGQKLTLGADPHNKLHPEFYILEFKPNSKHNFWAYCTVGMGLERDLDELIELFIFSPKQDASLVELLTVVESYHRSDTPIGLHHTFNIGRPWLDNSACEYGFISLPYLDGPELENFKYENKEVYCYWVIPITEAEQEYKIQNGCDALEDVFEDNGIRYLDPKRPSLI